MEEDFTGREAEAQSHAHAQAHAANPIQSSGPLPLMPANVEGRAQLLARASALVNTSSDLKAMCGAVIDDAAAVFGASAASVFLVTPTRYLDQVASSKLSDRFILEVEEIARAQDSSRLLSNDSVFATDLDTLATSAAYKALLERDGLRSLASLALVNRGKLLGYMTLYYEEPREYGRADRETLQTLANLLAPAIANVQFTESKRGEDEARDRFLSALSHELRTPLTSIMGFTQVIRKRIGAGPDPDPRLQDQLEVLWTQAQRLNRLIDAFVDLSNIERGDFAINSGKVDLSAALSAAITQALGQARSTQQVGLEMSAPAVWVQGDGKRLEQVFTHLVSNALRYSPPGQPIFVRCNLQSKEGRVTVEVIDQGPGIAPHLRKEIFERSNPGEAQRSGGLGVGLYLSKTIVEAHGGHIALQSSSLEGTTVSVTLPV